MKFIDLSSFLEYELPLIGTSLRWNCVNQFIEVKKKKKNLKNPWICIAKLLLFYHLSKKEMENISSLSLSLYSYRHLYTQTYILFACLKKWRSKLTKVVTLWREQQQSERGRGRWQTFKINLVLTIGFWIHENLW